MDLPVNFGIKNSGSRSRSIRVTIVKMTASLRRLNLLRHMTAARGAGKHVTPEHITRHYDYIHVHILHIYTDVTRWPSGLAARLSARKIVSSTLTACCVSSCLVKRDGLSS